MRPCPPHRIHLTAATLCLAAFFIRAEEPPPAAPPAPPEIRVLGKEGRVLLSRAKLPLAALRFRPQGDVKNPECVLEAKAAAEALASDSPRNAPLAAGGEQAREAMYPLPTGDPADTLSVVMRARRVAAGARVLVSGMTSGPSKADLAPGEMLPAAAALETALQIFSDADGKVPNLTYVDGQRQPAPNTIENEGDRTVRGRVLVFETEKNFRVTVARSAPVAWKFKRMADGLMLTARLQPDARDPANVGSFVLYLGAGADDAPPEISEVTLDKPQTPARDFVEGSMRVYASGADPYVLSEVAVVAEVAFPPRHDGEIVIKRLPCFFREAPSAAPAEGEFRFRFAPPAEGVYGVRIAIVTATGQLRTDAVPIRAGPPASAGFVRARTDERRFHFDDGSVFIPFGVALPPIENDSAAQLRQRFIEIARRGMNTVYLPLTRAHFPLENEKAGTFSIEVAAALDEILKAAQARGIHVVLSLESGEDLAKNSQRHPYFREMGGPLSAPAEFFRDVKARKLYQGRLTYAAARYGAYRSVLSFELVSGVEQCWPALKSDPEERTLTPGDADISRRARRDVQDWAQECTLYLSGMDQHGHCISMSTGVSPERPWSDLEKVPGLHFVTTSVDFAAEQKTWTKTKAWDEVDAMARWANASRQPGREHKPVWMNMAAAEPNAENELLLHNTAFGSIAQGLAGIPFLHAESMKRVDPEELAALAVFSAAVAELSLNEGREELRVHRELLQPASLEVVGRVARRGLAVWVRHSQSSWALKGGGGTVQSSEIRLPGIVEGEYTVTVLDTRTAVKLQQHAYRAPAKKVDQPLEPVVVKLPAFKGDVAVLVLPRRQ